MFKKIFDEIKYICKVATAGSKEARQLEKLKKTFEEAYRQKNNTATDDGVIMYSLMNDVTFEQNAEDIINMTDEVALQNKEQGNFIRVMNNTPSVILENVKDTEDYEVIIRFDALYLAARKDGALEGHYHDLGKDVITKLPEYIENPDAIVRMNNGRLNIFTTIETSKGNNGIISMEMNTVKDINSKYNKYNLVVSVFSAKDSYTKNNITKNGVSVEYKKEDLSQVNPQLYEWLAIFNDKSSTNIISNTTENVKEKQLEIINQYNPAPNTYNTWVRTIDDIKTFEEALADDVIAEYDEFNPDFDRAMAEQAIKNGEITVYSSYPIKQGVFVSPSYMEAESYSGDGIVYSKRVPLDSVAWIDITQGQYADTKTDDIKMSLSTANDDIGPVREHNNVYGEDIKLQVDGPVREDIAPGEATTENSIINGDEPIKATQSAETTKSSTHEDLVNQMSDIMDEANKSDTKANTVSQEFIDNSNKSFGIEKPNDYVHVQKQVFNTLKNEGFFTGEDNSRIDYNEDSGMVIETNRSGIKETFNFANYSNLGKTKKAIKLATIRKLPEIIKNSKLVDNDVNNYHSDNSSTKFAYIQSTIDVDGNDVSVQIDIKKSPQKNKFWVHRVYVLEKANELPAVASGAIKQAIDSSAYEDSLQNPNEDVKEDLPDYFVDSENKQKTKLTRKSLHEDIIFVYGCIKNYFNI